jgi:hypothetical protein
VSPGCKASAAFVSARSVVDTVGVSDRDPAEGTGGAEDQPPYDAGGPERSARGEGSMPAAPATAPSSGDAATPGERSGRAPNMLPGRQRRTLGLERLVVRLVATGGVIGIGVAIAAIMASSNSQGWLIGVVVATVSVVLSAILWSSRQL